MTMYREAKPLEIVDNIAYYPMKYLTPVEVTEAGILEVIEANATGPDYSDWELVAKAIVDKLKGE